MKKLPDSPPRIARHLRFPIIFLGLVDLALIGLAVVFWATPLHPVYPPNPAPDWTVRPQVASIVLPTPVQTSPSTPHRATLPPSQAVRVSHPASTLPKPPQSPTTVLVPSVAPTASNPAKPSATPTDTGSPDS